VDISIIIPTRGRALKLARCVRALQRQDIPSNASLTGRFEVIVSIDGEDDPSSAAAAEANWSDESPNPLRVIQGPREGINAARNRALPLARGRWCLFLNDDLYAQPNLLAEHALAHLEAEERVRAGAGSGPGEGGSGGGKDGAGAIIVGDAPWSVHSDDSLFDRMVRETSIIFFYHRMNGPREAADRWRDWGFRHCYTLNLSAPTHSLRAIDGFAVLPEVYGYDDLEAAFRLQTRFNMPVLYRPSAKGTHDHRYTPDDYLRREATLGRAAWWVARHSPRCAQAIFNRDITSEAEVRYSRDFVEREHSAAERLRASFIELGRTPSDVVAGPAGPRLMNLLYEQHLLLKRWEWRRGLLEAASGLPADVGAHTHPSPATLPSQRMVLTELKTA